MLILGCDTGLTNFGVAIIDREGNPLHLESYHFPKPKQKKPELLDRRDRLNLLVDKLTELLDKYPIEHIALEMPHRAPSLTGIVTTTLAVGAVITLARLRNIPVTPVGAQQVRARVFGKTKIEDEEMYLLLRTRPGVVLTNTPPSRESHALDGFATAQYLITPESNARSTRKAPSTKGSNRQRKPRVGKVRKKAGKNTSPSD